MSKKVITPAPEDFCKTIESFKKSVEEATERFNNIVTVVRCKDCKFLSSPPGSVMFCEHIHKFVDAEWFCADGKRR